MTKIIDILKAGTLAPSGENAQPWKFRVKNNEIDVFNIPERDQSLYNWGQRASYMANGAAIQNILIASKHFGFHPSLKLFPDTNQNHVANIQLKPGQQDDEGLYEFIERRVTNRKPYKLSVSTSDLQILSNCIEGSGVKPYFSTKDSDKIRLGLVGSTNERVMMDNQYLHSFFFNHISWSAEEDKKKKIGFYIETLELPKPAKAAFRIIKHWPVLKLLNKLGFNNSIWKQNGLVNAQTGAFGILTITKTDPKSFAEVGLALERLWLNATKLGLCMQPLTGTIFFKYQIMYGDTGKFSSKQVDIINAAYDEIQSVFNFPMNEKVAFMFRIGKADMPTAQSSKFSVEESTEFT